MPRKTRKRKSLWQVHYLASRKRVIPIGIAGKLATPIWVWGDLALANRIARFLNSRLPGA